LLKPGGQGSGARGADFLPGVVMLQAVVELSGLPLSVWLNRVDGSPGQAAGMGRRVLPGRLVLVRWWRLGILPSLLRQAWPVPMGG